ncbi:helix-turn-helix domain-containing protein [Rhodopseudomonas parapalustris]
MGLEKLLKDAGISAYRLSKTSNVSAATISEIKNGNRKSVKLETASKIAKALGVSIDTVQSAIGGE